MRQQIRILTALNDKTMRQEVLKCLNERKNFKIKTAANIEEVKAITKRAKAKYDAAIIDSSFGDRSKLAGIITSTRSYFPDIEIILIVRPEDRLDIKITKTSIKCFSAPIQSAELAMTIELSIMEKQYEHEKRISDKLHELSIAINSAVQLQEILDLTCKAAVQILNVDHSGLVLYQKDLTKGVVYAEYPSEIGIKERMIRVKNVPVEEKLVHERKIINIPDLGSDPLLKSKSSQELNSLLFEYGILSCLFVPVVLNKKVIASLSLDMIRRNRRFYKDEIELCKELADTVALAIGNSRYMDELSVLNQIGQTLSKAAQQEVSNILELIYEQTGRLMDVRNFYIAFYYREEEKEIKFKFAVEKGKILKPGEGDYEDREFGNGLTEHMIRTKQPVLIEKKPEEFLALHGLAAKGKMAGSWVGAPLIVGGEVLGVIGVQNFDTENVYDERDRDILLTIASQAAIAIKNARLLKERELRYNELDALHKTSLEISQQLELEPLLRAIVRRAADLLEAPGGGLLLREGRNEEIEMKFTHNMETLLGMKFKFGQGLAGRVALSGRPMFINNYQDWTEKDPRFGTKPYKGLIRALVEVPLKWQEEVIGVLAISDIEEQRTFNENDIRLLERFAGQAAIAIQNARLFNNKVKELEALVHADVALLTTMGLKEILETILDQLSENVESNLYLIRLWDEETRSLKLELTKGEHPGKISTSLNISSGLSGLAAFTKKTVMSDDARKEKRIKELIKNANDEEEKKFLQWIGSEINEPLIAQGELVGVMVAIKHEKKGFKMSDVRLMRNFARPAALALHNARLIQRYREHVSLVAHQLRGPIQAIWADTDYQVNFIKKGYGNDEKLNHYNRRLAEHFGKIQKELNNFSFLIREDKIGEHKYSMQKSLIHHVIEEAVSQFTENAGSRGIGIEINENVRELPVLEFDRENMFTVFTNLVENAVKYSNDNRDIRISGERTGNRVEIEVSNFGLGILYEDRERIFQLYTRGTLRHSKRFVQGTGIGLWVVKQIVRAHGGKVKVWSGLFDYRDNEIKKNEAGKRGVLTKFTIKLPV